MVQIDFFDTDVVQMLVPVLTLRPDKIFYLYDRRKHLPRHLKHARAAVQEIDDSIVVEYIEADGRDISQVREKIEEIIKKVQGEDIYVDITGGMELMIACGYELCRKNNLTLLYVDDVNGKIVDVLNGKVLCKTKELRLDDYMAAIGAKRLKKSHSEPHPSEYEAICHMAEFLFDHVTQWQLLHQHIATQMAGRTDMEFQVPVFLKHPTTYEKYNTQVLMKEFCKYGFAKRKKGKGLRFAFTGNRQREYMINYGVWLELYIYIKAKEVFKEVYLGVVIDWDSEDNIDTVDNEIDVLVMEKSSPVFISCKMKKPSSGDLYEVGYLARRLGGQNAKSVLATTWPVREETGKNGLYVRMRKMKIGILEAGSFKKMETEMIFEEMFRTIR